MANRTPNAAHNQSTGAYKQVRVKQVAQRGAEHLAELRAVRELEVVEAAPGRYNIGQVGGAALDHRVPAEVEQDERVHVREAVVL